MDKKENVTLFGRPEKDLEKEKECGNSVFGFLVLGLGVLFLLINIGVLPGEVMGYVWRFWPLLFVIWGFRIILGTNAIGRIIANLLGILIILGVGLFAVSMVNPEINSYLPRFLTGLFEFMKGVVL